MSWRCGGGAQLPAIRELATSATVSVAAQKTGGEETHPMGRPRKKRTRGFSPSGAGSTMPNCLAPSAFTLML